MPGVSGTISETGLEQAGLPYCWSASRRRGHWASFSSTAPRPYRLQGHEMRGSQRQFAPSRLFGRADGSELARWIAARRPIQRGPFRRGEERAIAGLAERVSNASFAARVFQPLLDDIYELLPPCRRHSTPATAAAGTEAVVRSTGTTTCRSSSSISSTASKPPPTTAHAASSSATAAGARGIS